MDIKLDTTLTPKLKMRGLIREIRHRIQMQKKALDKMMPFLEEMKDFIEKSPEDLKYWDSKLNEKTERQS